MFSMASSRIAIGRQVAHHQIVALFALQHLRQRIPAHGGLNGVLNIRDVDLIARGLLAIHLQRSGSAGPITRNTPRSSMPVNGAHDLDASSSALSSSVFRSSP